MARLQREVLVSEQGEDLDVGAHVLAEVRALDSERDFHVLTVELDARHLTDVDACDADSVTLVQPSDFGERSAVRRSAADERQRLHVERKVDEQQENGDEGCPHGHRVDRPQLR